MWTLRKETADTQDYSAETASVVERDNISNIGREALASLNNTTTNTQSVHNKSDE